MKSDIEYLRSSRGPAEAGQRERWMQTIPPAVAVLLGDRMGNGRRLRDRAPRRRRPHRDVRHERRARELGGPEGGRSPRRRRYSRHLAPTPSAPPARRLPRRAAVDRGPAASPASRDGRLEIIRDGSMSIQLEKDGFSAGFAAVTRIAQNNGGFVLSSQTRGQRRGTLVLRIPAKRFDDAMLALRDIGVVQAQSITGETSPRSTSISRRGCRTRSASEPFSATSWRRPRRSRRRSPCRTA